MNKPQTWIERSSRFRMRIEGPDRHKFLHNLTTNEIRRLPDKAGCEAFVTSPQGKTLGFVTVHNQGDSLLLRGDASSLESLRPHLAKYGMFDDVTLVDLTETTTEFHLFSEELGLDPSADVPQHPDYSVFSDSAIGGTYVTGIHESPTGGPGITYIVPREDAEAHRAFFAQSGVNTTSDARFDALRIIAGTPVFGRDITPDNLPQEVGRDAKAISFVKGCYLGQETVARIDALGHVNKILRGLRFSASEGVAPGTALGKDGKSVGTITSVVVDPRNGRMIGLGYVRVQHADAGTTLDVMGETPGTAAVVSELPIPESV